MVSGYSILAVKEEILIFWICAGLNCTASPCLVFGYWLLIPLFPPDTTRLPISSGWVLAPDNAVVPNMASNCDVYHLRCPPNLTPGIFESIRTLPSLTSTRACVDFWISYLPFWATFLPGALVSLLGLPRHVLPQPSLGSCSRLSFRHFSPRGQRLLLPMSMHLTGNRANSDPSPASEQGRGSSCQQVYPCSHLEGLKLAPW